MKSRLVSLTGATGFIGSHLATAYRSRGWRVRAIVRPGTLKPLPSGIDRRESALTAASLAHATAGSDVIVHAAGLTRARREDGFHVVNVLGTRAVVEAANACGARLVQLSSLAAIGPGTIERPARDTDPPRPVNAYGRSKLAGEMVIRESARVPWVILRPAAVYGPGDRAFLPLFRLAARGLFLLAGQRTMPFTFVHVDDVVRAVLLASEVEAGRGGDAMFIGHAEPHTTEGFLRQVAVSVQRPYRPVAVPRVLVRALATLGDLAWTLGRQPMFDSARLAELSSVGFVCSVERAREALGFTAAVTLPAGLEETVRWYRDRGWV
jgi:nucleoside-diphosphate-sugar epimerase